VPVVQLPEGTTVDTPGVRRALAGRSWHREGDPGLALGELRHDRRPRVRFQGRAHHVRRHLVPALRRRVRPAGDALKAAKAAAADTTVEGAQLRITGLDSLISTSDESNGPSVLAETLLGGLGALIVLAFVFGSLMAFVPLLMAALAIPTTFLVLWPLAEATDVSVVVQFLIALIGLGVAIDYSLLIVMRWREEIADGRDKTEATQYAMEHAGRAVLFSGIAVAIGLLALIVLPVPFLRSIGYGGLLIPLISVLVAVTILPVILATIGPWLDRVGVGRRTASHGEGWVPWAG